MKSSTLLLAAAFLAIGILVFLGMYSYVSDQTSEPQGQPDATHKDPPDVPDDGNATKPPRHPRNEHPRNGGDQQVKNVITGSVTDDEGQPVQGARVRLYQPPEERPEQSTAVWDEISIVNQLFEIDEEEWDHARPLATFSVAPKSLNERRALGIEVTSASEPSLTDDEGRFRIEFRRLVGPGPFTVRADKEGLGSANAAGVRAGADIELRLGEHGSVSGVILTALEGHAVPNAWVVFDDGEERHAARSGSDGRFTVEGIGPGTYPVRAGAEGLPPLTDSTVKVREGEDVEIRLPPGVELTVRAVAWTEDAEASAPLTGVRVVALSDDTYAYVTGMTGPDGRVVFKGLPPGNWMINGQIDGYATETEDLVVLDATRGTLVHELEFEPTVPSPITVVDPNGVPIAGVQFYSSTHEARYEQLRSVRVPGQSDAQGQFKFPFEFFGPRSIVYAFKEGYGLASIEQEGEDGEPIRVVLHPGVVLHGRVTDESGKGVPGAIVELEVELDDPEALDDAYVVLATDENGNYRFNYVPYGAATLDVYTREGDFADLVEFDVDGTAKEIVKDVPITDDE